MNSLNKNKRGDAILTSTFGVRKYIIKGVLMFIKYTFIIGDHCTNTAISTIQIVQKNYGVWEGSLKKYFVFRQIAHIYS